MSTFIRYSCIALAVILLGSFECRSGDICNANGNLVVFSNYEGGTLNIVADQNIPNMVLGIVSYQAITVNITGAFVANIQEIIFAGFENPLFTGVPQNIITIYSQVNNNPAIASYLGNELQFINLSLVNCITAGSSCAATDDEGGNSSPQIVQFFYSEFGPGTLLFAHFTQYQTFLPLDEYSISSGGNCCLEETNTPPNPIYAGNGSYNFLPSDTLLCGESLTLDLSSYPLLYQPPTYTGYVWSDGTTGPVIAITEPGVYSFYASDYCHYSEELYLRDTIVVLPCCVPPEPVIIASPDIEACEGETIQLSAGNFQNYLWSNGFVTSSIAVNASGIYSVIVSNEEDCPGNSNEVEIIFQLPPILTIQADDAVCEGSSTTIVASGAVNYQWNNGSTQSSQTFLISDTQQFTVTGASNGCASDTTFTVEVISVETVEIEGDSIVFAGESVDLMANGSFQEYLWIPSTGLSCDTCQITTATPAFGTHYILQALDSNGCAVYDSIFIQIDTFSPLYVPNSFSPDGDGINDYLFVKGMNIENFHLSVFNRCGDLIFESNDIQTPWTGGNQYYAEDGIYLYQIEYGPATSIKTISGHICLIR
jgi:gliding motility-associated-like protein